MVEPGKGCLSARQKVLGSIPNWVQANYKASLSKILNTYLLFKDMYMELLENYQKTLEKQPLVNSSKYPKWIWGYLQHSVPVKKTVRCAKRK